MLRKSEIRMSKSETSTNDRSSKFETGLWPGDRVLVIGNLGFEFVSDFEFRISNLISCLVFKEI